MVNYSAKNFNLPTSKLVAPIESIYLDAVGTAFQNLENPKLKMEFYRPLGCARGDSGLVIGDIGATPPS